MRHRRRGDDDHARARGEDRLLGALLRRRPGAADQEGQRHRLAREAAGKTLGVQSGTTGKDYATENAKGAELKDYEDLALELAAVKNGQVDAAVNDIPVLLDFAKQNPDVEVTATFKTGEQYGFGMKKGTSDELKGIVDDVIAKAAQRRHVRPDLREVVRPEA